MRDRIHALFMSRQQTVYLFTLMLNCVIIPSIGDVFEQSLYKNQIDYQNHSNAERLMSNVGAVIGALSALAVGDFFKEHVWLIFFATVFDWIGLWGRWQFYYNKQNFAIIVRNFAHESNEWRRTHSGK